MLPWAQIDTAEIPGGGGTLRLIKRGTEFAIMLGRTELMNSRRSGSETALATLSCGRIAGRPRPRVLIGGLGMGFTLRAAIAALGAGASVTVAELVPAVVAWARGPLAELFGDSLDDPRVAVCVEDVAGIIRAGEAAFDAILLDVDNGPDALTLPANDSLYDAGGLAAAHRALRPAGVLAIWSAEPDAAFVQRLRRSSFQVEEARVHAHGKRGIRQVIWLAARA